MLAEPNLIVAYEFFIRIPRSGEQLRLHKRFADGPLKVISARNGRLAHRALLHVGLRLANLTLAAAGPVQTSSVRDEVLP